MPDQRLHRGPNPDDLRDFAASELPRLAEAQSDLSWLLGRGYAHPSGIKLVGDRHALTARQRTAVLRCACSDQERHSRHNREIPASDLAGQVLIIDGFNLLTTVEAALAGGVVLVGRDGCCRDMASMNGHFKLVSETAPALALIMRTLERLNPRETVWLLDRPVSNSGRLGKFLRELGASRQWRVELVQNPDAVLAGSDAVVASADSAILDACARWVNLAHEVVFEQAPHAWMVRLEA
jgi:hypothetical protein